MLCRAVVPNKYSVGCFFAKFFMNLFFVDQQLKIVEKFDTLNDFHAKDSLKFDHYKDSNLENSIYFLMKSIFYCKHR